MLVLSACGGSAEPPQAEPAQPARSTGPQAEQEPLTVPEVPDDLEERADEAAMADLAALAEKEAGRLPRAVRGPLEGSDISWPQCPRGQGIPERRTLGLPMPLDSARYVVMGLTNGPAFFPNPCLAEQVSWVRERGLLAGAYAVTSYPDPQTLAELGERGPYDTGGSGDAYARQRNVGYQQALFNITTMREAGLPAPMIWVDVEPVRDWEWSDDLAANAAVVEGARRGYEDKGYRIGIYSTAHLWAQAVGGLSLGVPEWRAAGPTSRAEALRRCGASYVVQGGPAAMGQWVEDDRDLNVTCPGTDEQVLGWFHRF
ncbi:hypothetical protein I601_2960 [Nocardioides dokdonensis FR1436]|uniref:DUF1906 domain-containing protein n=1 Tax=Nocardioides dokdonensis FR1436 TaxID=1300347 RepID=A0A1A9GPG7_9ACTN|nr:hypothetical protein I601_2960 [Nocardioides dokdonensis FR1436]